MKPNSPPCSVPFPALLAFLFSIAPTSFADAAFRANAQANHDYEKEKYEDAAKGYLSAQLQMPKSSELNYNLGNANYKMKKYEKALEYYEKAVRTEDSQKEQRAQYNMGNAFYKLGEFEMGKGKEEGLEKLKQSINAYKRALELDPEDFDSKYNMEFVRRKLKEMSKRKKQDPKKKKKQGKQQQKPQPDSTKTQQKPKPKPGEMSEEEAKRLLDAYKDAEKDAKKKEKKQVRGRAGVSKDW